MNRSALISLIVAKFNDTLQPMGVNDIKFYTGEILKLFPTEDGVGQVFKEYF